jgi:hypothetical protein
MSTKHAYVEHFTKLADALLNHTLLVVKGPKDTKHYRVSEIEFYFNDHSVHKDTFTHGDEMQRHSGRWYFHKQNGMAFKSGTYKGLDLAIGKGDKAVGGILFRAMMPVKINGAKVEPSSCKVDFIEGPCLLVDKILADAQPEESKSFDLVALHKLPTFSATCDAFDTNSIVHLLPLNGKTTEQQMTLPKRDMVACPRVGLTLKKFDEYKHSFWMADYRYLVYPEFHGKMKDFIILSLIRQGLSAAAISSKAAAKVAKVEEMRSAYEQGRKLALTKTIKEMHKDTMVAADWALVYGMQQVLFK